MQNNKTLLLIFICLLSISCKKEGVPEIIVQEIECDTTKNYRLTGEWELIDGVSSISRNSLSFQDYLYHESFYGTDYNLNLIISSNPDTFYTTGSYDAKIYSSITKDTTLGQGAVFEPGTWGVKDISYQLQINPKYSYQVFDVYELTDSTLWLYVVYITEPFYFSTHLVEDAVACDFHFKK